MVNPIMLCCEMRWITHMLNEQNSLLIYKDKNGNITVDAIY